MVFYTGGCKTTCGLSGPSGTGTAVALACLAGDLCPPSHRCLARRARVATSAQIKGRLFCVCNGCVRDITKNLEKRLRETSPIGARLPACDIANWSSSARLWRRRWHDHRFPAGFVGESVSMDLECLAVECLAVALQVCVWRSIDVVTYVCSSVILLQAGWINILSRVGFPFEVSPTLLRLCHAVTMDGLRDMHTYIHMCKSVCMYIKMHTCIDLLPHSGTHKQKMIQIMTHSSLHVANHFGPQTQKDDTNYDASSVCQHIILARTRMIQIIITFLCECNMMTHGRCVIICIIFLGSWPEMVCKMQRAMRHNLYHLLCL